ncbi:cystathionine gamma-lyase [Kordiimonas sp. SCSIO 12610]|uniref:cystathionine gamma-lyase n=1 Tax=Kordiimonas sp. SCSIO 12610 TaxID=2829597 RepID=UPI00210E99E0|nr:cystathionine gamma-lyase [Kordiimonas sp. SCSIO 12610]UTW55122.1 cystathionine gamma-lyase [Kordiimonas sp. SCSIO 12610]
MTDHLKPSSKTVHSAHTDKRQGAPMMPGPVFSSTFHTHGMPSDAPYQYGRFHHPTWHHLEEKLSSLEGGETVIFPSGMGAIAAVLTTILESGDTVLMPSDGYYPSRAYVEQFLSRYGVMLKLAATKDMAETDFTGIKLVFIESPSNPMLDICDIQKVCERAHSSGALVAIDNTTATILGQNPLELGADFSVSSDTKALNGHSDILFGHVASNNVDAITRIRDWRKLSGCIPGPMETWLVDRGIQTLDVRLERQVKNAQHIAEYLINHAKVQSLRYPGLANDPSHTLAKAQMNHFGFIVTFDLGSRENADRFMARLNMITDATSFGGVHTIAERRARWGTDDIPEGTIRLSAGIEHIEDIIGDIEQSLDQI